MSTILLHVQDEARHQRLAEALQQAGMTVTSAFDHATPWPLIVVATGEPKDLRGLLAGEPRPVGWVALGWTGEADVKLPADATDREVVNLCQLLSENLRLRSENSASLRERGEMWRLAHSDPLTGIPNRRAWDQEVEQRFQAVTRLKTPLTLVLIDLDHFKNINDRYGHTVGDEVLKGAAGAVAASVRATDFIARMGGDEFGILLSDVEQQTAAAIIERLRRAIATRCSRAAGPIVSVSVGYTYLQPEDTYRRLFDRADTALMRAKSEGRDRAVSGA